MLSVSLRFFVIGDLFVRPIRAGDPGFVTERRQR
jgi:hypothetical protein